MSDRALRSGGSGESARSGGSARSGHDVDEASDGLVSRRTVLVGAGVAMGAVSAAGIATSLSGLRATESAVDCAGGVPVPAAGRHQAGVARPRIPQRHCLVLVGDVDAAHLRSSLAALGEAVLDVTTGSSDLTVTVGLGAGALAATAHPDLAGVVTLPDFAGDDALSSERRGGDVLLSINADDALALEPAAAALTETLAGWRPRWSDLGFRGSPDDGVARNPFGYHDGIIVPRTEQELSRDVWIDSGALEGGTICVIRRFALDVAGFRALPQDVRDRIVGREQWTGAPLSGGARDDEVDLSAKTPSGTPLIPTRSHARAAHPSFTGSGLMLRRSYSYRASANDSGHLFISFQNDVATFARTQLRLDETDDLMDFTRPTATAAFAVLPGFTRAQALGASLF